MLKRILLSTIVLTLACTAVAQGATKADLTKFFLRLESVGLQTYYLRRLVNEIEVFYRSPSSQAEAQWGYILNNMYIPADLREPNSTAIAFDVEAYRLNTVVHELCHADTDIFASKKAPKGTPQYEHWYVVNAVWGDIMNDPAQANFIGLPRYPRIKADEVISYYFGAAIQAVLEGAEDIYRYNLKYTELYIHSAADAERLSDKLVLPEQGVYSMAEKILQADYAKVPAGDNYAFFEGENIPWQQRRWVKEHAFAHVLGLKPPRTSAELIDCLNQARTPFNEEMRRQLVAARAAQVKELEQAGRADPLNILDELPVP